MYERTRFGTTPHSQKVVQDSDAYNTTARWRDKSGSPVEPQAIGMAWVRPCRSVGARAAPDAFAKEFNRVFGTAPHFAFVEPLP